jgi:hypothetical protein
LPHSNILMFLFLDKATSAGKWWFFSESSHSVWRAS